MAIVFDCSSHKIKMLAWIFNIVDDLKKVLTVKFLLSFNLSWANFTYSLQILLFFFIIICLFYIRHIILIEPFLSEKLSLLSSNFSRRLQDCTLFMILDSGRKKPIKVFGIRFELLIFFRLNFLIIWVYRIIFCFWTGLFFLRP